MLSPQSIISMIRLEPHLAFNPRHRRTYHEAQVSKWFVNLQFAYVAPNSTLSNQQGPTAEQNPNCFTGNPS